MIIERYLIREIATSFVGVTLLLLLIFMSGLLVQMLAGAAEGRFPADVVLTLVAAQMMSNLALVLPLSFFIGVLRALGRLYEDSEMVVLAACGVRPRRIVQSVMALALLVGLGVSAVSLWLGPWAQEQAQQLLDEVAARPELEGVMEGQFNRLGNGRFVVYVEEVGADRRELRRIFVRAVDDELTYIISAERGRQVLDAQGNRYLVLEDGRRYDGQPGQADYRIITFERHGLLIRERAVEPAERERRALPTLELMGSSNAGDIAEVQWRFAPPLATLLLALLAIPLSRTSPRQGRYGKLFLGIVVFVAYYNLLTAARGWLARGQLDPWLGLWWVHLLALAAALLYLYLQYRPRGPKTGVGQA